MKICPKIEITKWDDMISFENLFESFTRFRKGKKSKPDVAWFTMYAVRNIQILADDLRLGNYCHGGYTHFKINDPKPRDIHKASVRDRVVHHMLYQAFYPYFDRKFIHDSYSCRINKGTHRALKRFQEFSYRSSSNFTKPVWVLKCDIKKCFASVDHDILKKIIAQHIHDDRLMQCLDNVISSFKSGLPLGNLTSQILINIYLNELDQFIKRQCREKYYIRYADDFVIFGNDKKHLENVFEKINEFVKKDLGMEIHPQKIWLAELRTGIDFLGWVHFPKHRVLRNKTKWRMMRNLEKSNYDDAVTASYRGLLGHGNAYTIMSDLENRAMISV